MPERKNVTIDVGPLYTRGDLVKAPDGTSPQITNAVFRRGVVEKRGGFQYEFRSSSITTAGALYAFDDGDTSLLAVGSSNDATGGSYLVSESAATSKTAHGYYGFTAVENRLYSLGHEDDLSPRQSSIDELSVASETINATVTRIGGTALTNFIGRLIVGSPKFYHDRGGSQLQAFNSAAEWTVSGAWSQPTGAVVRTATIANATTDTIKSAAAVYTTGASEQFVTVCFDLQAVSATVSTPIRVRIENAAGTTVYGSEQYVIPSATTIPEWSQYYVTALVPASTAVYAALQIGNDTGGGTIGVTFRMSDSNNNYGCSAYPGRFIYPIGSCVVSPGSIDGDSFKNRIYWSEPLDVTDWRNENFAEVDEVGGNVTAMCVVNGRLVVFKRNAMWVFAPTNSALRPLTLEQFLPNYGCESSRSVTVYENVAYFVGASEVYRFDGGSMPVPICGSAMKDEMFPESGGGATMAYEPCVAVDAKNRELWAYCRKGRVYIYSIDEGSWVGTYRICSGSGGSATVEDLDVRGLCWAELSRGVPLMYLSVGDYGDPSWLVISTGAGGYDYVLPVGTGTNVTQSDIVSEYVFHALESPRPRKPLTLQRFGIDHQITGTQAASTTEYAVSLDGGSTWGKYNQVRIPVSSGGSIDTDPILVPLHQTSPRIAVKIKHTGPGGPTYFNVTGGEAEIIVRGRETQATNPTAVGSSL